MDHVIYFQELREFLIYRALRLVHSSEVRGAAISLLFTKSYGFPILPSDTSETAQRVSTVVLEETMLLPQKQ